MNLHRNIIKTSIVYSPKQFYGLFSLWYKTQNKYYESVCRTRVTELFTKWHCTFCSLKQARLCKRSYKAVKGIIKDLEQMPTKTRTPGC